MKKEITRILLAALTLSSASLVAKNAVARPWKPQATSLAQDYSVITDTRPNRELVILFWFSSPMAPSTNIQMQTVLDKYVVLGAVDGRIQADGTATFDSNSSLQASVNGKALTILEDDKIPPALVGMSAGMTSMISQSLGSVGKGIKIYIFDAGDFKACGTGQLSIAYSGENYTYDAPIPGCAKK